MNTRRLVVLALATALLSCCGARGTYAQPERPQPLVYLALGDSTGVGVGAKRGGYVRRLFARIKRARPGARLINLCASSAATEDLLRVQLSRVSHLRPTLVTLGVGANDLIRGVSAQQFARNFEEIVSRLKDETGAQLLVMNVPDISLAPAVPAYMRDSARRHIIAFNEQIAAIAVRHQLALIDLYRHSGDFSTHPEFFSPDGIHPSDAGYEFWADLLWSATERALVERRRLPAAERLRTTSHR